MKNAINNNIIPHHIAIIMDGNGRWAKVKNKKRSDGHIEGVMALRRCLETALQYGIKYLTVYAFSTENWKRPEEEVNALMGLFLQALANETDNLIAQQVRLNIIGDISKLPEENQKALCEALDKTSGGEKTTLTIAVSYSSHEEIVRAIQRLSASKTRASELKPEDVINALDTAGMPLPDLLIRTGGEKRLSNFLLLQLAYAELYFSDCYWPDFDKEEFAKAIESFQKRERRFGMTTDQIRNGEN